MPRPWAPAPKGMPLRSKTTVLPVVLHMSPQMGIDLNVYPRENEKWIMTYLKAEYYAAIEMFIKMSNNMET